MLVGKKGSARLACYCSCAVHRKRSFEKRQEVARELVPLRAGWSTAETTLVRFAPCDCGREVFALEARLN